MFPLAIHSSKRYLVDSSGHPFFIHGDTPWSIAAQLTDAEITSYLTDRASRGYNAILFNAIEHNFTSQTPKYRNVDGVDPFTTMTNFGGGMTSGHRNRLAHIVSTAKGLGIWCLINPAYFGFSDTEGWRAEIVAESDADLQTYGAELANLLNHGNVGWCMGGDKAGTQAERDKQWNVITGIRSVRTTDLVAGHSYEEDSYTAWNGYSGSGWGANNAINFCYPGAGTVYTACQTSYGRSGPIPYFMGEAIYEQERGTPITAAGLRRQAYTAILEGACGHFFGNNPVWHLEAPVPPALYTYSGTWESNLDSTGNQSMRFVKQLFSSYRWEKLKPKTDTSFITTSLGTGDNRIVGAVADDGTLGMVWTPTQNFTLNMTKFSSSVRARWFDGSTGAYTVVGIYSNSGTQAFTPSGERILVCDLPSKYRSRSHR